jgi:hypothetical protein
MKINVLVDKILPVFGPNLKSTITAQVEDFMEISEA